jgi:hypothetical protein
MPDWWVSLGEALMESELRPSELRPRSFTLTDAEREAIAWFSEAGKPLARLTQGHNLEQYRATLRLLLERLD